MRILFVSTQSPLPADSGSKIRTWGLMKTCASFADSGLVTLTRSQQEIDSVELLKEVCGYFDSRHAPRTLSRRFRDVALSALTGRPYLLCSNDERSLRSILWTALESWQPDVVQLEGIECSPYLRIVQSARVPVLFHAHNIQSHIEAGRAPDGQLMLSRPMRRISRYETHVAGSVGGVIAISQEEQQWWEGHCRKVFLIPNALFVKDYQFALPSTKRGATVVFIGHLGYAPNREAVEWLARDIFPRIQSGRKEARCLIAGKQPGRDVLSLENDAVRVLPNPFSIAEVWARGNVLLCPLKRGAGSRVKLLEAASYGVPVVATRFGAEGTMLREGVDYVAAETGDDLARAAIDLLKDSDLADRLALSARQTVEQYHDWDGLRNRVGKIYENITHHDYQE